MSVLDFDVVANGAFQFLGAAMGAAATGVDRMNPSLGRESDAMDPPERRKTLDEGSRLFSPQKGAFDTRVQSDGFGVRLPSDIDRLVGHDHGYRIRLDFAGPVLKAPRSPGEMDAAAGDGL